MCCQVADGGVAVQLLMTMLLCVVCQVADGGVADDDVTVCCQVADSDVAVLLSSGG